MQVKDMVKEIKAKMDKVGGLKNVYFIACGGSMASMNSGFYLMKNEAKDIGSNIFTSNEFVYNTPKALDERSVCVIASQKATAETVEAVKVANEKGATTIALTASMETGMAEVGEYVLTYTSRSKGNQATSLKVGFEILKQFEDYDHYDEAMAAYDKIDKVIEDAVEIILPRAKEFAKEYKDDDIFYVLGSGSTFGAAYTLANCHLMEMQWKHAVLIHSGEYFHGPFETTDKTLPMILFKSYGRSRALDERVERFIDQYAERIVKIDSVELGLEKIGSNVAEYFNSVLMVPIAYTYVNQMALARDHSMQKRRYMWQFEY